ncbi:hypothetical protein D3C80_1059390 [compost metagenome]
MTCVIVPDAAMTPVASRGLYPYFSMIGSEITPMVMTEAATVPVMAPRIAPTMMTA